LSEGIVVRGLEKRFGTRVAVEGLSFEVAPGEVFGLLGPNGAGKTTTVRMLTGLLQPSGGDAQVCGVSIRGNGSMLRSRLGLLTEQPGLYDRLTARENLRFFMKLHGLEEGDVWPLASQYLKRFGLAGREDEPCGGFSKGMRQKLAIVRTLLHSPAVIFLDEPTSGLDPEAARSVRDAVAELAADGRTLVLCSHNLAEVERLCSRVAVVKNRLLTVAPVRELRRHGSCLDVRLEGNAERFSAVVSALPSGPKVLSEGARLRVMLADENEAPDVIAALVHGGARIYSAGMTERPLEEVYLDLVGRTEKEAA
jgi:ABC-2 type transport system ATP-binding protein